MNKKYISLLSLIFIFLVVFGGTLLYLNRQKPIERMIPTTTEVLEDDSTREIEDISREIQGKAVCITSSGEIVKPVDAVECDSGIKTTDSKVYLIVFSEEFADFEEIDPSIFETGKKIKVTGKVVKVEDAVLDSFRVEKFEVI